MQEWLKDYCQKTNTQFDYADIKKNPPHELLGIGLDEYLASLDSFRMSDKALSMLPNCEIIAWMEKNGESFKHIALSATSHKTSGNGAFWTMKHFSKWINSYNIVPSYRLGENFIKQNETKKDFLVRIKVVDILIDDSEKNIADANSIGVKGFLIAKPWNNGGYTIEEILAKLDELKGAKNESF